jgi:hypothetical protein
LKKKCWHRLKMLRLIGISEDLTLLLLLTVGLVDTYVLL